MSANDDTPFAGLEPAAVWRHFATLCATPRASKSEAAIRDRLAQEMTALGLAPEVDGAGNLIVRKPASPGRESSPTVVLQGHLDMVCQKNADSAHDFTRDPIAPTLRDGWLVAEHTTLGADNGMGVSMILAALEDPTLSHGPLEALLTVDEETGMTGAHGLESTRLKGRLMLNLDTEDWGEFYLGCAGGLDVDVRAAVTAEALPAGYVTTTLSLRGLRGGHSGVDIHEGRGNAIRLLVGVLRALRAELPLRLARLDGGTARNAIAREAFAVVALPAEALAKLAPLLAREASRVRAELGAVDPGVTVVAQEGAADAVLSRDDEARWIAALSAAPYGVRRMSEKVPGVVETSNNLGVVSITPEEGRANLMVRSLVDAESVALADEIIALFAKHGIAGEASGAYPGWAPNPASPLLARCQAVYRALHGSDAAVKVIHAGLECGIIGAKYPGLDTVSFGPTIRGAHAPGERVEVASVGWAYDLLRRILTDLV
ncbi:MAG: aminoacyl-histidine dipeptidase [Polyangiales bacterium]